MDSKVCGVPSDDSRENSYRGLSSSSMSILEYHEPLSKAGTCRPRISLLEVFSCRLLSVVEDFFLRSFSSFCLW